MFVSGSRRSPPKPPRSEINRAVSGRICISPYAPRDDSTSGSNPLSVRITAATSVGSTPFAAAAERMASSYPRGYITRRTVSGTSRRNGNARRTRARATSKTTPRLRRLRDLPYLPLLGSFFATPRIPLPEHPLYQILRLLPEFIEILVVLYHHIRPPGLFFARELTILYRAALLLAHAPLLCPPPTSLLRHRDSHGNVELAAALALEEERYLGHEELRAGDPSATLRLLTHPRVQDLFEVLQSFGVPKDLPTQSLAIYPLLAAHAFPEAPRNGCYRLIVARQEIVDDLIGGDGLGPAIAEHLHESALAR